VHRDGRLEANVGFVLKVAWVEGPAFTSCQRSVSAAVTRWGLLAQGGADSEEGSVGLAVVIASLAGYPLQSAAARPAQRYDGTHPGKGL